MVTRLESDAAIVEHLHALMDEDWEDLYPVSDPGGLRALVLSQGAEIGEGDDAVPYTAIEVIAGPIGNATLAAVTGWHFERDGYVHPNRLTRQQTADIAAGRVGTWQLLDGPEPLLKRTNPGRVSELDLHSPYSTVEDPPTVQDVTDMMRVLSPELQERVKAYVEGMTDAVDSVTGEERSGK